MPLEVLAQEGRLRLCDNGLNGTHSSAEALQCLQMVTGELDIPNLLSPYIFDTDEVPECDSLRRIVRDGVDVYIVEVSDDRQFSYNGICLQQNFVTRNLIQPHRGALLGWYREVCQSGAAEEATVLTALEKLERGGFRHDKAMAELLRGIRLDRHGVDEIAGAIRAMKAKVGGRWIIVSLFDVPGDDGAVMKDRRSLHAKLQEAAAQSGAEYFDPTVLIVEHGRSVALDGGGADIYEYAPAFYPTVGESLIKFVRGEKAAKKAGAKATPAATASATVAPAVLAQRVNDVLVQLHRRRLDELGTDPSGLYAHYKAVMERGALITPRETAVLDLVTSYLPAYEAYAVMRAGLGELALLLAASGRRTTAYEANGPRRLAIQAGAESLEACGLLAPGMLTIADTLTPAGPLEMRTLGVGLNVIGASDEAEAARLLATLAPFDALLVDLRLMFRIREDSAEQEGVAQSLGKLGFQKRRDYRPAALIWVGKDGVSPAPRIEPPSIAVSPWLSLPTESRPPRRIGWLARLIDVFGFGPDELV